MSQTCVCVLLMVFLFGAIFSSDFHVNGKKSFRIQFTRYNNNNGALILLVLVWMKDEKDGDGSGNFFENTFFF